MGKGFEKLRKSSMYLAMLDSNRAQKGILVIISVHSS